MISSSFWFMHSDTVHSFNPASDAAALPGQFKNEADGDPATAFKLFLQPSTSDTDLLEQVSSDGLVPSQLHAAFLELSRHTIAQHAAVSQAADGAEQHGASAELEASEAAVEPVTVAQVPGVPNPLEANASLPTALPAEVAAAAPTNADEAVPVASRVQLHGSQAVAEPVVTEQIPNVQALASTDQQLTSRPQVGEAGPEGASPAHRLVSASDNHQQVAQQQSQVSTGSNSLQAVDPQAPAAEIRLTALGVAEQVVAQDARAQSEPVASPAADPLAQATSAAASEQEAIPAPSVRVSPSALDGQRQEVSPPSRSFETATPQGSLVPSGSALQGVENGGEAEAVGGSAEVQTGALRRSNASAGSERLLQARVEEPASTSVPAPEARAVDGQRLEAQASRLAPPQPLRVEGAVIAGEQAQAPVALEVRPQVGAPAAVDSSAALADADMNMSMEMATNVDVNVDVDAGEERPMDSEALLAAERARESQSVGEGARRAAIDVLQPRAFDASLQMSVDTPAQVNLPLEVPEPPTVRGPGVGAQQQAAIQERIAEESLFLLRMGRNEAEIQLEPPELGMLKLHIIVERQSVHGRIEVENPAVQAALQADLSQLNSALSQLGLDVRGFEISLMDERRFQNRRDGRSPGQQARRPSAETTETKAATPRRLSSGSQVVDYLL